MKCAVTIVENNGQQLRLQVGPMGQPAASLLLNDLHVMILTLLNEEQTVEPRTRNVWVECSCAHACSTTSAHMLLQSALQGRAVLCKSLQKELDVVELAPDLTLCKGPLFEALHMREGALQVHEQLGQGSYGTVHRGVLNGRTVAVKVFSQVRLVFYVHSGFSLPLSHSLS